MVSKSCNWMRLKSVRSKNYKVGLKEDSSTVTLLIPKETMRRRQDWSIFSIINGPVSRATNSSNQTCRRIPPNQWRCMVALILQWWASRDNNHPKQRHLSWQLITRGRKYKSQPSSSVTLTISVLQTPYWFRIRNSIPIQCLQGISTTVFLTVM